MRPIIPITVPAISAVVKLLPFDEGEELGAVLEGGELEVGVFDNMEDIPEAEDTVGEIIAGLEESEGDGDSEMVVIVMEFPVCCAAPKQRQDAELTQSSKYAPVVHD
jgi:hypothetical protein